jgi:starch phosphorylase
MFIFGERVEGVNKVRGQLHEGLKDYVSPQLQRVFDAIHCGTFGDVSVIHNLIDATSNGGDHYITCFDFASYLSAQQRADDTYRNYRKWTEMAIRGIACSGFFSSDRTIKEYCKEIWDIEAVPIP